MGLLSNIAKIFKPSKDDVNKVLDTIDPPITEEPCCVNGQCTCGAAETADELVSEILSESTLAAQKERQKEEQKHEDLNLDFETLRDETQPGRIAATRTVLPDGSLREEREDEQQDGDGSGPIKPKARTKTKSTRKKGTRKSRKK